MNPSLTIRLGGAAVIDVTTPCIENKAYGSEKLKKTLGVPVADITFIDDAICACMEK
jgi:hypothetical protein